MADEQPVPIYLSPDEDLTSVRERLERSQARRIILVIPPQTQLRSHVGWRLIHARMREMGKDLLVISPDRQVRAVARAAGFRVAETQESSSSHPRLGSGTRPSSAHSRGSASRSRLGGSSGGPDSRAPQAQAGERRLTPNASRQPLKPLPPPEPDLFEDDDTTLSRPGQPGPSSAEKQPGGPPTTLKEKRFQISTTPSVHPSVPGHPVDDDDALEADAYYADYDTARRIRASASGLGIPSEQAAEDDFPSSKGTKGSDGSNAKRWNTDLFPYIEEEEQPSVLPEQRGSMPGLFEEVGTNVPDISDRSTEIMESEIEDLGDLGAVTPPNLTALPKPGAPPVEQSARPKRPNQHSPRSPRPASPGFDDDDDLLAFPDRPTRARPSRGLAGQSPQRPSQTMRPTPNTQRPSQTLRPAPDTQRPSQTLRPTPNTQRPSQTLRPAQPQAQPARQSQTLKPAQPQAPSPRQSQTLRPAQPQQARGRTGRPGSRTPILPPRASATSKPRQAWRGTRVLSVLFTLVVLLLIVAGFLLYFVPTATVTISLQTQSYSQAVTLTASANPRSGTAHTIQAQVLTYTTPVSGQGNATGQTSVGNTNAQGLVTFTNNGATDVVVPTGTVITSTSGVPFATTAEAFVPHGGGFPFVPITAQQAGVTGNVRANTVTIIPPDSLSKIATRNNITTQALNLTVTNPKATSQGGAKNVPSVTQQDLQALKNLLHKKLQVQLKAWLAAQTQKNDFDGTPMPNVLASANPLPVEKFSGLPAVGQAEESGSFSGTLSAQVKVLVARASAINAAARAVLNAAAQQMRPQPMLLTQLPITLLNARSVASADGTSLTISGQAFGAIMKPINPQDLSGTLAGKSLTQVSSELKSSMAQVGVKDVQISVSPSFLSFMPLRADRIQVILQPLPPVLNNATKG